MLRIHSKLHSVSVSFCGLYPFRPFLFFSMSESVNKRSHDCKRSTEEWVVWANNLGHQDITVDPSGELGKVLTFLVNS